jgi:hypothetical protein
MIDALFVTCPLAALAQSDRDALVQNIERKRATYAESAKQIRREGERLTRL